MYVRTDQYSLVAVGVLAAIAGLTVFEHIWMTAIGALMAVGAAASIIVREYDLNDRLWEASRWTTVFAPGVVILFAGVTTDWLLGLILGLTFMVFGAVGLQDWATTPQLFGIVTIGFAAATIVLGMTAGVRTALPLGIVTLAFPTVLGLKYVDRHDTAWWYGVPAIGFGAAALAAFRWGSFWVGVVSAFVAAVFLANIVWYVDKTRGGTSV